MNEKNKGLTISEDERKELEAVLAKAKPYEAGELALDDQNIDWDRFKAGLARIILGLD